MAAMIKTTITFLTVMVLAGGLVACAPLKVINAITPTGSYDRQSDIAYGSDPRQKLDVYTPRDLKTAAPVVVFFYGGSWDSGARADYKFVGQALASRGIVAVVADYRVYPQVRYPDFLDDSARAVAWTVKEVSRFGGDPKHMFVMGHSAGGYNAAMIALDSRWLAKTGLTPNALRGWIGLAGPYDFIPIESPIVKPVFFFPNTPPDSQPINHVTANVPPALLLASMNDTTVDPQRNTAGLAKKLQAAGDSVTVHYFSGTDHPLLVAAFAWPLRWLAPVLDDVEQFVKSDGERIAIKQK